MRRRRRPADQETRASHGKARPKEHEGTSLICVRKTTRGEMRSQGHGGHSGNSGGGSGGSGVKSSGGSTRRSGPENGLAKRQGRPAQKNATHRANLSAARFRCLISGPISEPGFRLGSLLGAAFGASIVAFVCLVRFGANLSCACFGRAAAFPCLLGTFWGLRVCTLFAVRFSVPDQMRLAILFSALKMAASTGCVKNGPHFRPAFRPSSEIAPVLKS